MNEQTRRMEEVATSELPRFREFLMEAGKELLEACARLEAQGRPMDVIRVHTAAMSSAAMFFGTLMSAGVDIHATLLPHPPTEDRLVNHFFSMVSDEFGEARRNARAQHH